MKKYLQALWNKAEKHNYNNIFSLLTNNPQAVFLDCGCAEGKFTQEVASKIATEHIFGIETVEQLIPQARQRGVNVKKADLNGKFPFADESIDVVCANQVIEHIINIENFVDEIYRVLKKNGYAVISTENLASWHNMVPLLFGWQPFSLTNIFANKLGLGNPWALHRNEKLTFSSWQHVRVLAYRGLRELFELKGFKVEAILGAGYYPFLSVLAKIDVRHAAFLTIKIRKA